MALTKRERAILIEARRLIETGAMKRICSTAWSVDPEGSKRLRNYIIDSLNGHFVLEMWLLRNHGINVGDEPNWQERMRATRLAWIDWMLDQPEAK